MTQAIKQKIEQYMPQFVDTINKLTELEDLCADGNVSPKELHGVAIQLYFKLLGEHRCSKLLDESILYHNNDRSESESGTTGPEEDEKLQQE